MRQDADGEATLATTQLGETYDVLAPDGSEIRLLVSTRRGSLAHGTLPPGQVSRPVTHRTVEEVWYVTEGSGQIWRKLGEAEVVIDARPGTALAIPLGAHFQFRASAQEPLRFVMCTMPPWPGPEEAMPVPGYWPVPEAEILPSSG